MADYSFHYRPDIQGMRGVSVLLVVLFHAQLYVTGGFVGVDTFFVISGFVICGGFFKNIQRNENVSLASFYSRRVRRLLPSLAALSIAVLLAGVFLAPYSSVRFMAHTAVAATFFNANHYLMLGAGYFDPAAEKNAFLHTWSLSVEEQFYFILPCFILLVVWLARARQKDHLRLFVQASLAIFGISFALTARFRQKNIKIAFIKPIPKFSNKATYQPGAGHLEEYKGMDCSIFRLKYFPDTCGMSRPLAQPDHPRWRDENLGRSA